MAVEDHPLYQTWKAMRRRCADPKNNRYYRYGGRGIRVCYEWEHSFATFADDMGPKPSPKHTLDRIDNDGDYTPENCRWADPVEQMNKTSANRLIVFDRQTKTLAQWCRDRELSYDKVKRRLLLGWTVEQAFDVEPPPPAGNRYWGHRRTFRRDQPGGTV